MRRYNLFIVSDPAYQSPRDFSRIAELVEETAPDIRAEYLSVARRGRGPRWRSLLRPTLTVRINDGGRFRPLRGAVAAIGRRDKVSEYRRLEAAGLPVPKWCELLPGTTLDPAEWGSHVVEKPAHGGRGAYVRLRRTGRVRYRAPEELPQDYPGQVKRVLVQRFVRTGDQPEATRVLTCFGKVVAAIHYRNVGAQLPERPNPELGRLTTTVVASARGSHVVAADDPAVLALGSACHAAFPEVPILGTDVMREQATGKLWVAEVNCGYCWMLSNGEGLAVQQQFGLDFYRQFDGLRRAAEGMVEATRRLAR